MFILLSVPNYRVEEKEGSWRQKGGGRDDEFRCSATAGLQMKIKRGCWRTAIWRRWVRERGGVWKAKRWFPEMWRVINELFKIDIIKRRDSHVLSWIGRSTLDVICIVCTAHCYSGWQNDKHSRLTVQGSDMQYHANTGPSLRSHTAGSETAAQL